MEIKKKVYIFIRYLLILITHMYAITLFFPTELITSIKFCTYHLRLWPLQRVSCSTLWEFILRSLYFILYLALYLYYLFQ